MPSAHKPSLAVLTSRGLCSIARAHAISGVGRPRARASRSWRRLRATPRPILTGSIGVSDAVMSSVLRPADPLKKLSVVIPARDEAGSVAATVEHLHVELALKQVPHEIVVVDDGSTDRTWEILVELQRRIPQLAPIRNTGPHGFGRAIVCGFDHLAGDAVAVMMADESDDCRDVVRYWEVLNDGWDCVFGSRWMAGGGVIDYPWGKRVLNRLVNRAIALLFGIRYND